MVLDVPYSFDRGSGILYEKIFSLKTSGNEVYYTASSLSVILKNSCSKLHSQKLFKLKLFSYKIFPRVDTSDVDHIFTKNAKIINSQYTAAATMRDLYREAVE